MIRLSIKNKINNTINHLNMRDKIDNNILKNINTIVDCTGHQDVKLIDGCLLVNDKYLLDDINGLEINDIHYGDEFAGFLWQFNNDAIAIYLFKKVNLIT